MYTNAGGYCWHEALCQPNPSRSAYTPGGGGRQPGAALRIVETQYMQMSDCMSATLAAPFDKVIYKQSARQQGEPLGVYIDEEMHHSAWSYAPFPECLCWRSKDDGGQQFRCLRASLEALSLRGSGRGRHHSSPPGLLLQVRMTKDREMQSACVCRDSAALPISIYEHQAAVCVVGPSVCPVVRLLQTSAVAGAPDARYQRR